MDTKTRAPVGIGFTPPDYEWNHKTISAYCSGIGVVPDLIKIHTNISEETLARMGSDDERFALLDGVANSLDIRIDRWIDFYNAIRLLENHPEHWKARGYATFEALLIKKLGASLGQWRELEDLYHYASTARPNLFKISRADVAKMHKVIEEIAPAKKMGRPAKTDLAATMVEAAAYKEHGPNTLPHVIGRIKRDRKLGIIAQALKESKDGVVGNFVKEDRLGNRSWHVATFQKAAGMKTGQERRKQTKGSFARNFARITAGVDLAEILAALRKYPRIVKGLAPR